MKKRITLGLAALLCTVAIMSSCSGAGDGSSDANVSTDALAGDTGNVSEDGYLYGDVYIHSISELNLTGETDDHADTEGRSSFELNFRERVEIPRKILGTTNPYYPRLKRVSENNYLLFYNIGKTDPSCFVARSTDLKNWEKGTPLFEGTADKYYATCDAVVLQNGDILAVASFRPTAWGDYTGDMSKSGLVLRRSTDGGKSWSDMQLIYTGMNWEPYLLQLKSGEVQCFFTHTAPYTYLYGYNSAQRSSGIGLIRSYDNGNTWTPNVTGAPYAADIASQTYIGEWAGYAKMFTEQMPAVVELHTGTMLMACESKLDFVKDSPFRVIVSRSYDNWAPLALDQQGPTDKQTLPAAHASGPYVAQMKSGETVVSYYGTNGMNTVVGDSTGKYFSSATQPFAEHNSSYWGSLEVLGSHALLGVCDDDTKAGNVAIRRISYGVMYLNHDLYSKNTAVTVDGDGKEWKDNTDALFVGSLSQAQASVRFAADGDDVCILIERLDEYLSEGGDEVELFFAAKGSTDYYKLVIDGKGVKSVKKFKNKKAEDFDCTAKAAVVCVGTVGNDGDTDTGYSAEIKLSAAEFGISLTDGIRVTANLKNKDENKQFATDSVSGHDVQKLDTWAFVSLK